MMVLIPCRNRHQQGCLAGWDGRVDDRISSGSRVERLHPAAVPGVAGRQEERKALDSFSG